MATGPEKAPTIEQNNLNAVEAVPSNPQQAAEATIASAQGSLNSIPQSLNETKNEIPSVATQLELVVKAGGLVYDMALDSKARGAAWNLYIKSIDTFRKAFANLPPLERASSSNKMRITDAMKRQDTKALLQVFVEEKAYMEKPMWRKLPGVNFAGNFFGAAKDFAGDLTKGVGVLGVSAYDSANPWASPEEKEQAARVMAALKQPFTNFNEFAQEYVRIPEMEEMIAKEGGLDQEAMAGRYAFDALTFFLSFGAALKAGKQVVGITKPVLKEAAAAAVATAKTIPREIAAVAVSSEAKGVLGGVVGKRVIETTLELGKEVGKEVAKEAPIIAAKETKA